MLDIYLNREAVKFEQRFSVIVDEVTDRVESLSSQLAEVADRIDHASGAAADYVVTPGEPIKEDLEACWELGPRSRRSS